MRRIVCDNRTATLVDKLCIVRDGTFSFAVRTSRRDCPVFVTAGAKPRDIDNLWRARV